MGWRDFSQAELVAGSSEALGWDLGFHCVVLTLRCPVHSMKLTELCSHLELLQGLLKSQLPEDTVTVLTITSHREQLG